MKKIYAAFCKFEELVALLLLAGLTVLVFVSALMRYIKMPLNWAQDVALVAFAWMIFLGSDIAIRGAGLIGIDLLVKRFPAVVRKGMDIVFKVIILGFLCVLVVNDDRHRLEPPDHRAAYQLQLGHDGGAGRRAADDYLHHHPSG